MAEVAIILLLAVVVWILRLIHRTLVAHERAFSDMAARLDSLNVELAKIRRCVEAIENETG
jgi:hypothetical protein